MALLNKTNALAWMGSVGKTWIRFEAAQAAKDGIVPPGRVFTGPLRMRAVVLIPFTIDVPTPTLFAGGTLTGPFAYTGTPIPKAINTRKLFVNFIVFSPFREM
jgi:hypothetical protein